MIPKISQMSVLLIVAGLVAYPLFAQVKVQVFTSNIIDATLGTGVLTQLPIPPCGTDCGTPTFTYNKLRDDTLLKIVYTDTVADIGAVNSTCQYQLRIDGLQSSSADTAPAPYLTGSNIVNTTLSSTGVFSGLSRGPHIISIWHRQFGATNCVRNSGGFTTTIVVEELKLQKDENNDQGDQDHDN